MQPYMGMSAILFNDAEPLKQNDKIPSTKYTMWNLVKIGLAVSEKMSLEKFKDYMILYMYIAQGQGQISPGGWGGQNLDYNL